MSCSKDKPSKKKKPGRFACEKCGAIQKKKKKVCKPVKVVGE